MKPRAIKLGVRNRLEGKAGNRRRCSVGAWKVGSLVCAACAVVSNNTNIPVFFMLPPERTALGDPAFGSIEARKGFSRGGNKQLREGQGYEGDGHLGLKFL